MIKPASSDQNNEVKKNSHKKFFNSQAEKQKVKEFESITPMKGRFQENNEDLFNTEQTAKQQSGNYYGLTQEKKSQFEMIPQISYIKLYKPIKNQVNSATQISAEESLISQNDQQIIQNQYNSSINQVKIDQNHNFSAQNNTSVQNIRDSILLPPAYFRYVDKNQKREMHSQQYLINKTSAIKRRVKNNYSKQSTIQLYFNLNFNQQFKGYVIDTFKQQSIPNVIFIQTPQNKQFFGQVVSQIRKAKNTQIAYYNFTPQRSQYSGYINKIFRIFDKQYFINKDLNDVYQGVCNSKKVKIIQSTQQIWINQKYLQSCYGTVDQSKISEYVFITKHCDCGFQCGCDKNDVFQFQLNSMQRKSFKMQQLSYQQEEDLIVDNFESNFTLETVNANVSSRFQLNLSDKPEDFIIQKQSEEASILGLQEQNDPIFIEKNTESEQKLIALNYNYEQEIYFGYQITPRQVQDFIIAFEKNPNEKQFGFEVKFQNKSQQQIYINPIEQCKCCGIVKMSMTEQEQSTPLSFYCQQVCFGLAKGKKYREGNETCQFSFENDSVHKGNIENEEQNTLVDSQIFILSRPGEEILSDQDEFSEQDLTVLPNHTKIVTKNLETSFKGFDTNQRKIQDYFIEFQPNLKEIHFGVQQLNFKRSDQQVYINPIEQCKCCGIVKMSMTEQEQSTPLSFYCQQVCFGLAKGKRIREGNETCQFSFNNDSVHKGIIENEEQNTLVDSQIFILSRPGEEILLDQDKITSQVQKKDFNQKSQIIFQQNQIFQGYKKSKMELSCNTFSIESIHNKNCFGVEQLQQNKTDLQIYLDKSQMTENVQQIDNQDDKSEQEIYINRGEMTNVKEKYFEREVCEFIRYATQQIQINKVEAKQCAYLKSYEKFYNLQSIYKQQNETFSGYQNSNQQLQEANFLFDQESKFYGKNQYNRRRSETMFQINKNQLVNFFGLGQTKFEIQLQEVFFINQNFSGQFSGHIRSEIYTSKTSCEQMICLDLTRIKDNQLYQGYTSQFVKQGLPSIFISKNKMMLPEIFSGKIQEYEILRQVKVPQNIIFFNLPCSQENFSFGWINYKRSLSEIQISGNKAKFSNFSGQCKLEYNCQQLNEYDFNPSDDSEDDVGSEPSPFYVQLRSNTEYILENCSTPSEKSIIVNNKTDLQQENLQSETRNQNVVKQIQEGTESCDASSDDSYDDGTISQEIVESDSVLPESIGQSTLRQENVAYNASLPIRNRIQLKKYTVNEKTSRPQLKLRHLLSNQYYYRSLTPENKSNKRDFLTFSNMIKSSRRPYFAIQTQVTPQRSHSHVNLEFQTKNEPVSTNKKNDFVNKIRQTDQNPSIFQSNIVVRSALKPSHNNLNQNNQLIFDDEDECNVSDDKHEIQLSKMLVNCNQSSDIKSNQIPPTLTRDDTTIFSAVHAHYQQINSTNLKGNNNFRNSYHEKPTLNVTNYEERNRRQSHQQGLRNVLNPIKGKTSSMFSVSNKKKNLCSTPELKSNRLKNSSEMNIVLLRSNMQINYY